MDRDRQHLALLILGQLRAAPRPLTAEQLCKRCLGGSRRWSESNVYAQIRRLHNKGLLAFPPISQQDAENALRRARILLDAEDEVINEDDLPGKPIRYRITVRGRRGLLASQRAQSAVSRRLKY